MAIGIELNLISIPITILNQIWINLEMKIKVNSLIPSYYFGLLEKYMIVASSPFPDGKSTGRSKRSR
jgi:hypothetical protein